MSEIGELDSDQRAFLDPYLPPHENPPSAISPKHTAQHDDLPFVTLTYASSLDSMIALSPGARTTLSGPETKTMTHYLRLRHDAILIGAGTAAVDDPSLNCRYPGSSLQDQPRPVIIDPNARWQPAGKKAHRLAAEGLGNAPWVVTRSQPSSVDPLLQVGGDYITIHGGDPDPSGGGEAAQQSSHISWKAIFMELKSRGVQSVMVEGGAAVINDLLTMPDLVDVMIITIAPTFLGQGGVVVAPPARSTNGKHVNAAWLQETKWRQFGSDAVLCGRLLNR